MYVRHRHSTGSRKDVSNAYSKSRLLRDSSWKPGDVESSFAEIYKDHQSHDRAERLYLLALKSRKRKPGEGYVESLIDVAELAWV